MTKKLALSPDLSIPLTAVTQKLAFLGISGSGKTYAAGKFAEELLGAGMQVVVLDTVGNWYGLRLASDGKKPGISIPILGGAKGDVPLEPTAGREVAGLIDDSRASMIVDVSDFTRGELGRFVLDFAVELLRLKKKAPSPVMVVWEECQDVVPQRVMGDMARTVGAVERLIKKGRNYGVGTVLISQRPAAVNKDVLSQIETLFAFRLNGKHDRKQIQDWIVEKDLDIAAMVGELPSMKTGSCYVWSPEWLGIFQKVTVGKKWTFDASKTPEFGAQVKAGSLAPVDLEKFKKTMSTAIESAKANDPEVLKKRIRELEAASKWTETKIVEKPVIKEKDLARFEKAIDALAQRQQVVTSELGSLLTELKRVRAPEVRLPTGQHTLVATRVEVPTNGHGRAYGKFDRLGYPEVNKGTSPPRRFASVADAYSKAGATPTNLTGPEKRILDAVAWLENLGITAPEQTAVAFLAGYRIGGGAYNNPRGRLKVSGPIDYVPGNRIQLTDAGRKLAQPSPTPLTNRDLHEAVLARLPGPEQRLLKPLLRLFPDGLDNEGLAQEAGYDAGGGAFNNPRGRLKTLGLIEKVGSEFRARAILFPEGS